MSGHNSHCTEDIGWHFGIAIDGSRKQVQCRFCSKVIRGGITRLKQHLAHKTGDVAPFPDVSAKVKRDMMKLLTEYKEKKRQKTRIARNLEDEITRSFNRNDYVDDEEEEDAQLAHARYESLEQHRFEHEQRVYRASRGAHFDEGGSSRPPSVPQMYRSATVRESSSRASRDMDMAYEQMSTPAVRLRAVEVELEKDRTRTKQSKVNTNWLKAAKNKMIKAFGSWVIDTNVPFAVVDSIYTNPLLETIREVGPDVRAPSSYELSDEQPVFEGDDLNWLNLDENEVNAAIDVEEDDDPQPDASAPFRYSVDQQPQDMHRSDRDSEENLSPSSSHGGSGGGGDRGNGGANEMGASYSSRRSTDYFSDRDRDRSRGVPLEDDRRSRRSPNEQPNEPTQTYRRIRKGKEPAQPHGYPTDAMHGYAGFQEAPSHFTGPDLFASSGGHDTYGGFSNNYGYNTNCPPLPYPSNKPQFVGSDSGRRHSDNPPIINQGTINYGDHHYYQPTFYSGDSNSSEQSWMDSTASSHYHQQQESYGVHQNNNDTYQDPPHHSFWW
ncbi:hypothetical protein Cgig2_013542 [Carnegiea gigantea]|uniref:BED-type domain-containing protein n=1 Tax=Carnegiea gigantea TaxID=171969 RepID=A0A9Q1Q7S1_9CARY|nr:hypothetical protein Cgig2_013542 [Carnegiea gigantea]